MLRPAARPYTRYSWGLCRTTSRVLVPIDPVDPKTVMVFITGQSRPSATAIISRRVWSTFTVLILDLASGFAYFRGPLNPFGRRGGLLQGSFYLEVSLALVGVASPA